MDVVADCNLVEGNQELVVKGHDKRKVFHEKIDFFFRLFCLVGQSHSSHHLLHVKKKLLIIAVFFG